MRSRRVTKPWEECPRRCRWRIGVTDLQCSGERSSRAQQYRSVVLPPRWNGFPSRFQLSPHRTQEAPDRHDPRPPDDSEASPYWVFVVSRAMLSAGAAAAVSAAGAAAVVTVLSAAGACSAFGPQAAS